MPTLRPRKRASASSSSLVSISPATSTVPESGCSRPAITISSVDLPEPDGPTRPTASPAPICRPTSFRMCTRAAPCPSDRSTPASDIAGPERFRMPMIRSRLRSYGTGKGWVQRIAALAVTMACLTLLELAHAADEPLKIVALGDSLTAGLGLPAQDAFTTKLQAALKAKGYDVTIVNAGVSGDTAAAGLERLEWSVP